MSGAKVYGSNKSKPSKMSMTNADVLKFRKHQRSRQPGPQVEERVYHRIHSKFAASCSWQSVWMLSEWLLYRLTTLWRADRESNAFRACRAFCIMNTDHRSTAVRYLRYKCMRRPTARTFRWNHTLQQKTGGPVFDHGHFDFGSKLYNSLRAQCAAN
jgi:hypothetical protein